MPERPTWQFRLSDLFALTTLAAVAAGLATALGPGTLLLSIGAILAIANWRGALAPLQTGRPQMIVLALAWCLFLISLALPSIHVFGPVAGWAAAWYAIVAPLEAVWKNGAREPALLYFLGLNLANAGIALLPVWMWRLRRGSGQWCSAALCVVAVFPWSFGWSTPMLVGYYVWCLAFHLTLCGLPIRWPTLVAMLTLIGALGGLARWGPWW